MPPTKEDQLANAITQMGKMFQNLSERMEKVELDKVRANDPTPNLRAGFKESKDIIEYSETDLEKMCKEALLKAHNLGHEIPMMSPAGIVPRVDPPKEPDRMVRSGCCTRCKGVLIVRIRGAYSNEPRFKDGKYYHPSVEGWAASNRCSLSQKAIRATTDARIIYGVK